MKYRFDETIDRSQTNAFKWKARLLDNDGKKIYPMWVADMEFDAAPAIQKRLEERVKETILKNKAYYIITSYFILKTL